MTAYLLESYSAPDEISAGQFGALQSHDDDDDVGSNGYLWIIRCSNYALLARLSKGQKLVSIGLCKHEIRRGSVLARGALLRAPSWHTSCSLDTNALLTVEIKSVDVEILLTSLPTAISFITVRVQYSDI